MLKALFPLISLALLCAGLAHADNLDDVNEGHYCNQDECEDDSVAVEDAADAEEVAALEAFLREIRGASALTFKALDDGFSPGLNPKFSLQSRRARVRSPWRFDDQGLGVATQIKMLQSKNRRDWFLKTRADYKWGKWGELISSTVTSPSPTLDFGRNFNWHLEKNISAELQLGWSF